MSCGRSQQQWDPALDRPLLGEKRVATTERVGPNKVTALYRRHSVASSNWQYIQLGSIVVGISYIFRLVMLKPGPSKIGSTRKIVGLIVCAYTIMFLYLNYVVACLAPCCVSLIGLLWWRFYRWVYPSRTAVFTYDHQAPRSRGKRSPRSARSIGQMAQVVPYGCRRVSAPCRALILALTST